VERFSNADAGASTGRTLGRVGWLVVDDGMDSFPPGTCASTALRKSNKLLVAVVALHVATDDGAVEDRLSAATACGAVTSIVVGNRFRRGPSSSDTGRGASRPWSGSSHRPTANDGMSGRIDGK